MAGKKYRVDTRKTKTTHGRKTKATPKPKKKPTGSRHGPGMIGKTAQTIVNRRKVIDDASGY